MGHDLPANGPFELVDLSVPLVDQIAFGLPMVLLEEDLSGREVHVVRQLQHPCEVVTDLGKWIARAEDAEQFAKHDSMSFLVTESRG